MYNSMNFPVCQNGKSGHMFFTAGDLSFAILQNVLAAQIT